MNLKSKIYLFWELNYSLIQILCTQAVLIHDNQCRWAETVINSLNRINQTHTIFWSSFIFILNDKIRKGWYMNEVLFFTKLLIIHENVISIGNSITFLIRSSSTWSTHCNKFSNEAVHIRLILASKVIQSLHRSNCDKRYEVYKTAQK